MQIGNIDVYGNRRCGWNCSERYPCTFNFRLGYGILTDENGHQPSWVISVRSAAGDVAETDRTRAVNYVCHDPAVAVTLVARGRRDETVRRVDQSTAYRVRRGQYCRNYARAG